MNPQLELEQPLEISPQTFILVTYLPLLPSATITPPFSPLRPQFLLRSGSSFALKLELDQRADQKKEEEDGENVAA